MSDDKTAQPHMSHDEHVRSHARYRKLMDLVSEAQKDTYRDLYDAYYPSIDNSKATAHPEEPMCVVTRNNCSMVAPVDDAFIVNWLVVYGIDTPIPPYTERAAHVAELLSRLQEMYPEDYLSTVTTGTYEHYKKGVYFVTGVATHHDTNTRHVIYHPLDNPGLLWTRPIEEFTGTAVVDGKQLQRFRKLNIS